MPFAKCFVRLAVIIACIAPATAGALSPPQATSDTARSDPARAPDPRTAIYELRTYYPAPGKLAALNARFREHTLALFARHGMTNVAYWNEAPSPEAPDGRVIYVLAYPDRAARDAAWKAFGSDPEWRAIAAASEANGKLVAKVDSVFMTMTDYSPPLSLKRR
ncbi:NIPSNAP family protein [Sphingomonas sp. Leaf343]|uniref:NIPSNAP family protein n=1 Tax=Sphingomonas sp. Leaf343 TaxID=1736345 RepID=UPI0009EBDD98|nr:NIPSNAP family protein [Sphingomonas sp. Leaf343]